MEVEMKKTTSLLALLATATFLCVQFTVAEEPKDAEVAQPATIPQATYPGQPFPQIIAQPNPYRPQVAQQPARNTPAPIAGTGYVSSAAPHEAARQKFMQLADAWSRQMTIDELKEFGSEIEASIKERQQEKQLSEIEKALSEIIKQNPDSSAAKSAKRALNALKAGNNANDYDPGTGEGFDVSPPATAAPLYRAS